MSRTAVVTGAAGGLGRAVVADLATHGWDVVAVVRAGGAALPDGPAGVTVVEGDVRTDLAGPLRAVLRGRAVDLLVNNAATGTPARPVLTEIDPAELLRVVDVNAVGPLRLVQALLPSLLAAADPLVLNVSSRLGSVADQAAGGYRHLGTSYAYRVSKAALNMLTTCLAGELDGRVRVWSVHPGVLATGMGQAGATTPPEEAAARLRRLATSSDRTSPRFVTLDDPGGPDLAW
ncbi:SDR family NAD(P)-dependent oxidoreductase [Kineosporia sp. A_224]|uniref:SDR family NAD(P)-dependent oxidoreductase n=1 Tax=Kineosporia sp. A_224 TaxID=1962180 RepID=UPI000B4ACF4A|nr:SDR family NAD(P)-dependent oxidoreductase [Kineosporia sp. A_224]